MQKKNLAQSSNKIKGQVFVEFLLFFFIIITISFTLLQGINGAVAERWKALVIVISNPTESSIEIR